jgi:hypothetical protein
MVVDWWMRLAHGSGELDRGGAKGSSKGFSSNALEDCRKRSSKPDMMNQTQAAMLLGSS